MNELFVLVMWAASAARIAFMAYWPGQATKLAPAMKKFRQGIVPAILVLFALVPVSQARGLPGEHPSGSNQPDRGVFAEMRDGVSLDEAVSQAERQYKARVVRTEVQDEDGRKVYVLKLLSADGRVFTVRIDAATGRMR